MHESSQQETFL